MLWIMVEVCTKNPESVIDHGSLGVASCNIIILLPSVSLFGAIDQQPRTTTKDVVNGLGMFAEAFSVPSTLTM